VAVDDPLVPVTAKLYNPNDVPENVVTVSEGDAGGVIGVEGLGSQVGGITGCAIVVVTTQVKVMGEDEPLGCRLRVAVAVLPGSTAAGSGDDTVRVNCAEATGTDAAETVNSSNAKESGRNIRREIICLDFTMNG
jgi:hypothetical protein